jgi:preprotein translocase subunit SecE
LNPAKFAREVKQEAKKVVWPTRKEVTVSVLMVLVLATVSAIFFVFIDSLIAFAVGWVLGIGG